MSAEMQALKLVVETWNTLKVNERKFNRQDMRKFIEIMNANTRRLISVIGVQDPEFYTGLFELATHACTLTTKGAKIFGDGIDRTNV